MTTELTRIRLSRRRVALLTERLWDESKGVQLGLVPKWAETTEVARNEFTANVRAALNTCGIDVGNGDTNETRP